MKTLEMNVLDSWEFNTQRNVVKKVICSWQMAPKILQNALGLSEHT